jgi:hypothetical protein
LQARELMASELARWSTLIGEAKLAVK